MRHAGILASHGLLVPDALVSGIPFSTMSRDEGTRIMETFASSLAPGGRFVAYQFSNRVGALCSDFMGPAQSTTERLNIPPMRVTAGASRPTAPARVRRIEPGTRGRARRNGIPAGCRPASCRPADLR